MAITSLQKYLELLVGLLHSHWLKISNCFSLSPISCLMANLGKNTTYYTKIFLENEPKTEDEAVI